MNGSIAPDHQSDVLDEGHGETKGGLWFFTGEGGDDDLLLMVLGQEGSGWLGFGCEDDVGDHEGMTGIRLKVFISEVEGLGWVDGFPEEHSDCW